MKENFQLRFRICESRYSQRGKAAAKHAPAKKVEAHHHAKPVKHAPAKPEKIVPHKPAAKPASKHAPAKPHGTHHAPAKNGAKAHKHVKPVPKHAAKKH